MKNKVLLFVSLLVLLATVFSACNPAPKGIETNHVNYATVTPEKVLTEGGMTNEEKQGSAAKAETAAEKIIATTPVAVPQEERRNVYYEPESVQIKEQAGVSYMLVAGNLPDPCHQASYEIEVADKLKTNLIHLFSYVPAESAGKICAQMLQPFELSIPLPANGYASQITLD